MTNITFDTPSDNTDQQQEPYHTTKRIGTHRENQGAEGCRGDCVYSRRRTFFDYTRWIAREVWQRNRCEQWQELFGDEATG